MYKVTFCSHAIARKIVDCHTASRPCFPARTEIETDARISILSTREVFAIFIVVAAFVAYIAFSHNNSDSERQIAKTLVGTTSSPSETFIGARPGSQLSTNHPAISNPKATQSIPESGGAKRLEDKVLTLKAST